MEASYNLLTGLFTKIEIRGTDAAGFWGTTRAGKIAYHKEPIKSSEFVQKDMWKSVADLDINLMLLHARAASQGSGFPSNNKNNHPFVSTDRSIGLVHNGKIPDGEYDVLKKKYEVKSDCDSEILLRIFEATENNEEHAVEAEQQMSIRLGSIKNIWSQVVKGHMATAIGERLNENDRRLWIFRNKHRSLWLADMRKPLGQIFFFSTPEIWQAAVAANFNILRPFLKKKVKLIELPADEIWTMSVSATNETVEDNFVKKFDVKTQGFFSEEYTGPTLQIVKKSPVAEVLTKLEDDDGVKYNYQSQQNSSSWNNNNNQKKKTYTHQSTHIPTPKEELETTPGNGHRGVPNYSLIPFRSDDVDYKKRIEKNDMPEFKYNIDDLGAIVKEINSLLLEIDTTISNKKKEGSLTNSAFEDTKNGLQDILYELRAIHVIANSY